MPTGGAFNCPSGTGPVVDSEVRILCDADAVPFLRRYDIDNGTVTFVDTELDGATTFTPVEPVGICGPAGDESPAEPCDATTPMSTVGLCLADGSPIAVVATRGCDGAVTQDGWINLTTGAFSAGAPPAGTIACGETRSIQVSGVFCDLDPATGDVLGLVLIEYQYNPDGSIASVTLLDATTGQPYTVQGELSTCPAGVEQPEQDLVQLCDVAADGAVTPFVRDYRRDENGVVVGFSDYGLDGSTYTPAGTVTLCDLTQPEESPAEPCLHCQTLTLCDSGDAGDAADIFAAGPPPNGPTSGTLPNGVGWSVNIGEPGTGIVAGHYRFGPFLGLDGPQIWTFDQPVMVRFSIANLCTAADFLCAELPDGVELETLSPNHSWDPATRRVCNAVNTPDCTALDESVFVTTGPVTSLAVVYGSPEITGGTVATSLMELAPAPVATPFLRRLCYSCDGEVQPVTDTLLDGVTEYVPVGEVGVCGPTTGGEPEECRDAATVLLCDIPVDGVEGAPTATDTDPTPYPNDPDPLRCVNPVPGGAASLWAGGSVVFPVTTTGCDPVGQQVLLGAAATLQAAQPACDDGTVTITAQVEVTNDGPNASVSNYAGGFRLHRADTGAVLFATPPAVLGGTAPGESRTLSAQAAAPASLLSAGQVVVVLDVESFDASGNPGTQWTADQFEATFAFGIAGCDTQFLRKIVTDCETGAVISVTDTTLEGDPYTVTGDVGQCEVAGGGGCCPEECRNSTTVLLCGVDDESPGEPTATPIGDTTPFNAWLGYNVPPAANWCQVAGTPGTLFTGGSTVLGPGQACPDGSGAMHEVIAATLTAPVEDCATAQINVSVRVTNDGPNPGVFGDGIVALWNVSTGQRIAVAQVAQDAPVGHVQTLTLAAQVPAAALVDGDIAFSIDLETEHVGEKSWTVDQFSWDFVAPGCATRFFRTITTDCDGNVVSITDTDLNGEPVEAPPNVTDCESIGGTQPPEPCRNTNTVLLCDEGETPEQTEPVPFPLPDGPAQGVLPNGVAWTVNAGTWIAPYYGVRPPGGTPPNGPQTWTFDQPVRLRFGMAGLNGDAECAELPPDVELVSLAASHTWDPVTRMLCGPVDETPQSDTSVFETPAPVTSLTWQAVGDPLLIRGVSFMEVTVGEPPTQFLRNLTLDCVTGQVVSTVDTDLDGNPYEPVGEVGECTTAGGACCPPEPCRNTSTLLVCDLPTDGEPDPTVTDTDPTPLSTQDGQVGTNPVPGGAVALWGGGTLTIPPDTARPPDGHPQYLRTFAATVQATRPACDAGTATVTATIRTERTGPDPGCAGTGWLLLLVGGNRVAGMATTRGTPVGTVDVLTVTATVPAAELEAGNVALLGGLETYHTSPSCPGGSNPDGARIGGWTVDEFAADVVYDQAGCAAQVFANVVTDCETGQVESVTYTDTQGNPYEPIGEIGECTPAGPAQQPCNDCETITLCDTGDTSPGESPAEAESTPFLRHICRDCNGQITFVEDTTLDGEPYEVIGEVGVCGPTSGEQEECRDAATVLLCDLDTTGAEPAPVVSNTDPTPYFRFPNINELAEPAAEAAVFWAGGPDTVGPDPVPPAPAIVTHRYLAATVQAARPACDDGTAVLTASFAWLFNGPTVGVGGTGQFWLVHTSDSATNLASTTYPNSTPVGAAGTLTLSATVDAAELAAGNYVLVTNPETYHGGGKSWTLSGFAATVAFNQADCAEQFLRKVVTDCETGAVISVTDTTLEGDPYTVTGDVGECQPITPEPCQVSDTFTVAKCDDLTDESPGEVVCFTEIWGISCEGGPPSLVHTYRDDPGTEYIPTNPVDCCDLETPGASVVGVVARRAELQPGQTWDAAQYPLLQSITAVAVTGQGQVTDNNGDVSTLYQGENATWSVLHEFDLTLQAPLTIEATTGVVTINWTEAVTS